MCVWRAWGWLKVAAGNGFLAFLGWLKVAAGNGFLAFMGWLKVGRAVNWFQITPTVLSILCYRCANEFKIAHSLIQC